MSGLFKIIGFTVFFSEQLWIFVNILLAALRTKTALPE